MARRFPPTLARILGEMTAGLLRDAASGPALLTQFAATRDENAFRELVRLYGPLVWGVCQRCLRDPNDAEDALQATFIVLARKADRIRQPERLSAWLHGVALRAALNVRKQNARRHEKLLESLPNDREATATVDADLRESLDVELDRLPENLRQAFVLCRIEGRTYAQAAELLGCSLQTVANRVARAEERLRERLQERGLAPAGALMGLWPPASVGVSVMERVARGALDGPSTTAVALAEAVIRGMSGARALGWIAVLAVGTVLLASAGFALCRVAAPPQADAPAVAPPVAAPVRLTMRHNASIEGMWHLTDGKSMLAVDGKGGIRVWELATGKELRRLDGVASSGKFASTFHPPTLAILDHGTPQHFTLWNVETGAVTRENEAMRTLLDKLPHPRLAVLDGKIVFTKAIDNRFYVYDTATARIEAQRDMVRQLRDVVVVSPSRAIVHFVPPPLPPEEQIKARKSGVTRQSIFWPYLMTPSTGRGTLLALGWEPSEYPTKLSWVTTSADGQKLAVVWNNDGKGPMFYTRVLDAQTGELKQRISHTGVLCRAAFNADASELALVLHTETEQWIEFHDLAGKGGHRVLKTDAVALSFAADGKSFTTGDANGTIRLWDVATLKPVEAR
jgi:RNA polymerase sigma factor (sigma-70 family)